MSICDTIERALELKKPEETKGWIGVDLDGTLAYYDHWRGVDHIGEPVKRMVDRVEKWLDDGKLVKIMTARVTPQSGAEKVILEWLKTHVKGSERISGITHQKDFKMIELWDDRVVQVIPNTGKRADRLD